MAELQDRGDRGAESSPTDPADEAHPYETVISADAPFFQVGLREVWRSRELVSTFVWRDLKVRYKQTVLGFVWALLAPVIRMVVFTVIFGKLVKVDSEGFPYAIFVYAGLLPWGYFSNSFTSIANSLVSQGPLLTKVYFPRLVIPIAALGGKLVDLLIAFLVLVGLMLWYDVPVGWRILGVIPLTVLAMLAALGAGAMIGALNAAYRDFRHITQFLIQLWMYVTPVVYSVKIVPAGWQWLISLNPMTAVVDGYRSAILGKDVDWSSMAIGTVVTLVLLPIGLFCFRRIERKFADIV
ncbi:MAG: ABC transporter permease [Phycisphaerae bacterium]